MIIGEVFMGMWRSIGFAIVALFATQGALASPIVFTFNSDVTFADANPYGVAVGDSSSLNLIFDNGGSGFLSQSWDIVDIISATWTSGVYSATWSDSTTNWFNATSPQFATDAAGNVVAANFQGSSSFTGVDNGGASAYLYQDGVEISGNGYLGTNDFFDAPASSWQVSLAPTGAVSSPATIALFGLGLLGLRLWRKA